MNNLPRWSLTGGLPSFRDSESATAMEQTYKLYKAVDELITKYNEFVSKIETDLTQFKEEYRSDWEVYSQSLRQEFQDFIDVVDLKINGISVLENEIEKIKQVLASDDVSLDTLQELVNALKNDDTAINSIFTELAKKQNKLVAGEGINIDENNVISFTGGTFNVVYDEEKESLTITTGGVE